MVVPQDEVFASSNFFVIPMSNMKMLVKKTIPFDFVVDELASLSPYVKPMFGAYAIYIENKIVLILRDKNQDFDSGVWLATTIEHHSSLQKVFPSMRSISIFGPGPTGWQSLPLDSEDFEESVLRACELILKNDVRIGKIPKLKKSKKLKSKRT
jgi:hypothetical protein